MALSNSFADFPEDLPIGVWGQTEIGHQWLKQRYQVSPIALACIFGFTETCLIPGISAAGATPNARRHTALADAEFLYNGCSGSCHYALPPLEAGLSPTLITRAVWEKLHWPLYLFNAGLPEPPTVPTIDLQSKPAQCLSSGQAMESTLALDLFEQGLSWGLKFVELARLYPHTNCPKERRVWNTVVPWHHPAIEAQNHPLEQNYLILGECVVGGTTSALAVLLGLGIDAIGKVNSSHANCNHAQKTKIVQQGLANAALSPQADPLNVVAALGDPMQIVAAGMALTASQYIGVLLAGGTQMLAVYALAAALAAYHGISWDAQKVVVGTTRWVMEDPTSNPAGLIAAIGQHFGPDHLPCTLTTQLNFAHSHHAQLRAYEQGYVKEGVAAGGSAIAASLSAGCQKPDLLLTIDELTDRYISWRNQIFNDS